MTYLLFVRRLKLSIRAQALWLMALLPCYAKFICFKYFGSHDFYPELPELTIWLWDFAYSGAMILFALAIVAFPHFRGKAVLLPLVAWSISAIGVWNGIKLPEVHEVKLSYADLPAELDGYRIAQISDLHCSSAARRWRTEKIVEIANSLEVDLICLTGDYVDGLVTNRLNDIAPIARLQAKDGVYAVTGNHEYYFNYRNWMKAYQDLGLKFLTNACVFPRPSLALGGVPDQTGSLRHLSVPADVRGAFAAATNGEFRILMCHRPQQAAAVARELNVKLQLSGHTHGGIAPIVRELVATHNSGYCLGEYRHGTSILYVSPGCGQWAGFPIRFLNPSQIVVFELRRR